MLAYIIPRSTVDVVGWALNYQCLLSSTLNVLSYLLSHI